MGHTPGPWVLVDRKEDGYIDVKIGKTTISTLDLGDTDPAYPESELLANAQLISAAPDLLEQLEKFVFWYQQMRAVISLVKGYPDPSGLIENLDHKIPHFNTVIAKARRNK